VLLGLAALGGASARAECGHPYYPSLVGMEWTYTSLRAGTSHTMTDETVERIVAIDGPRVVFDVTSSEAGQFKGQRLDKSEAYQVAAHCDGAGVRKPTRIVKHEQQTEEEGVWLARPSQLQPGKTWTHRFSSLTSHERTSRRRGATKIEYRMGVSELFTVHGFERVQVPAGEFDALKIVVERQHETKIDTTNMGPRAEAMLDGLEGRLGTPLVAKQTVEVLWFAKGVGLVKAGTAASRSAVGSTATTKELVRFSPGAGR
jgi:hypothetical protein